MGERSREVPSTARPFVAWLTTAGDLRVPEITAMFWIIKGLSIAMGESTSDYLVHAITPELAVVLGFAGFLFALVLQFRMGRYVAWTYWFCRPWFPVTLPYDLLGGEGLAFGALLPVALFGAWQLRRHRALWRGLAMVAAIVLTLWVVGPEALPSRYFLKLVPAVGALVALAVSRRPAFVALVVVGVAAQLVTRAPELREDQVPNRRAAALVSATERLGLRACATASTATGLDAYVTGYREIRAGAALESCDLVVTARVIPDKALVREATRVFPYTSRLDAEQPASVFSRLPFPELLSPARSPAAWGGSRGSGGAVR